MTIKEEYSCFDLLYRNGGWNGVGSGPGSLPANAMEYIKLLNVMLHTTPTIKSILDIGCGDWQLMSQVNLGNIFYTGIDVSPFVIEQNSKKYGGLNRIFEVANPVFDDFHYADLVIIKDCLQHIPNADVKTILGKLRGRCKYALITNDITNRNIEIESLAYHRAVNVLLPPYNLPGVTIKVYNGKQVTLTTFGV